MTSDHSLPEEEDAALAPTRGYPFQAFIQEPDQRAHRTPREGSPAQAWGAGGEGLPWVQSTGLGAWPTPGPHCWCVSRWRAASFMRSQPGELPQGLGWACRDTWRRDGVASRKFHGRFWAPPMLHSRPFLQGRCPLGCSSDCGERWDRAGLISLPLVCSGAPQKLGGEWLGPQSTGWGPLDAGWGGAGAQPPGSMGARVPELQVQLM